MDRPNGWLIYQVIEAILAMLFLWPFTILLVVIVIAVAHEIVK